MKGIDSPFDYGKVNQTGYVRNFNFDWEYSNYLNQ